MWRFYSLTLRYQSKNNSRDTELQFNERRIQNVAWGHLYTVHLKKGVDENLPQSPIIPHRQPLPFPLTQHTTPNTFHIHLLYPLQQDLIPNIHMICFLSILCTAINNSTAAPSLFCCVIRQKFSLPVVRGQKIFGDWSLNLGCEHIKIGVSHCFSPSRASSGAGQHKWLPAAVSRSWSNGCDAIWSSQAQMCICSAVRP